MSLEQEAIREELSAYLDGELDEAGTRRVEQAVKADAQLATELDGLRSARGLVRQLPHHSAPAGVLENVIARAERESLLGGVGERSRRAAWAGPLAVAAALVIAVGISAALLVSGRQRSATPVAVDADRGLDGKEDTLAMAPARPAAQPKSAGRPAASVVPLNFVINTDNLTEAQRDVEQVFRTNSLLVAAEDAPAAVGGRFAKVRARSNFYQAVRTPTQVRYEVVLSDDQLRQIVDQLNAIRGRQKVAQIPMREVELAGQNVELAMAEGAARDEDGARGRRAGGQSFLLANGHYKMGKYGARRPAKMPADEHELAPAIAPRPAGAPTTRPSSALPKAVAGVAEPLAGREKDKKDAEGLFAAWYDRSQRSPGDARGALPSGPAFSAPAIARAQAAPAAPTTPAPGALSEHANGTLGAPAPQRRTSLRSLFRQGRATTFGAAHMRQFVVILNDVCAAEAGQ